MNVPLEIVQDDQGTLRDVNGHAMIMIFNSKARLPKTSRRCFSSKEKLIAVGRRSFAFINVTKPDEADEDARKVIRTHVMQDLRQRERQKSSSRSKMLSLAANKWKTSYGKKSPAQNTLSLSVPSHPSTDGPAFVGFPVKMQPYMRRLIYQCA